MRVLCINNGKGHMQEAYLPDVIIGEEYNVVKILDVGEVDYYILEEQPDHIAYIYWLFIPLSDIDEMEFERNYNLKPEYAS